MLCAVLHATVWAAEQDLPDEKTVLAAVDTIFADPFSKAAQEARKVVIEYSQGTEKMTIVVAKGCGFYPGNRWSAELLGHYIAGAVRYYLKNPSKASDERAGMQAGLMASMELYDKIKSREPAFRVEDLDSADERISKGEAGLVVKEALQRAEKERRGA
jgi:hypothetical protein